MSTERDFDFTEKDFRRIQSLVSEHTGIALSDAKQDMVYSRLARRVRKLQMDGFHDYCQLIERGEDETELIEFVNSITTNLTSFFREMHHFDHLKESLLPDLMEQNHATKQIRIWSAGCSTGEEPYSIAMMVREVVPPDWDIKILATDLDTNVLDKAGAGVYDAERVVGLSEERLKQWFRNGTGRNQGRVRVSSELRSLISFKQLNLMKDWPLKGPMDAIFCRNVVIYFDKQTQTTLFGRFADVIRKEGHLYVGHSESLFKVTKRFKLQGKTIYREMS